MAEVKDLSELTLKDLRQEVKDEAQLQGDINQRTLEMVRLILKQSLDQEVLGTQLRNVANKLKRVDLEECMAGTRPIYLSRNRREAIRGYKQRERQWYWKYPQAVDCPGKDRDELLDFLDTPPAYRVKVRTTNATERPFREVRRRTRQITCSNNAKSVDRIVYGVISHLNKNGRISLYTKLHNKLDAIISHIIFVSSIMGGVYFTILDKLYFARLQINAKNHAATNQ